MEKERKTVKEITKQNKQERKRIKQRNEHKKKK